MVGRGDVYGVDVAAAQHLAKVDIGLAVAVLVASVDLALGGVALLGPHVADGHILHIVALQEIVLIAGPHIADADPAHHDAVAGGRSLVVAQAGCRDEVGDGQCRAGRARGLQELAAIRIVVVVHEFPLGDDVEGDKRSLWVAESRALAPRSHLVGSRRRFRPRAVESISYHPAPCTCPASREQITDFLPGRADPAPQLRETSASKLPT